jgi:hypothetical protein
MNEKKDHSRVWRPMRTAPRDGKPILITWEGMKKPIIAWWAEPLHGFDAGWEGDSILTRIYDPDPPFFFGWQPIDPSPKRKIV